MIDWLADAARYAELWLEFQLRSTEQPGCVLAIAHEGTLVAERAFGRADLASAAALTPAHGFRVASHSKLFTAAGIMLLLETGRLRLDDRIDAHVGGLTAAVGGVTVAEVLSHGAGLPRDGTDAGHWQDRRPFLDAAALRAELAEPPTLEANIRFKYSNLGYGLLGLVIEAVTGEPYGEWMMRHVVGPSGLGATGPDMPVGDRIPMATGHSVRLPFGERFATPGHNPTHALAAATGFVSTAGDLARFVGSLDPAAAASVLSRASRREMTRRHRRVPHLDPERHYGLGTILGTTAGHEWFGHSGAFQGFISRTACVPGWGVTVSIVTNAIDGLANPWVDGVVGILHEFSRHGAPRPEVQEWAGRWWSYWGALDLVPMGGKVLIGVPGQLAPFADASELDVSGPADAIIALANGFGSHGERVHRTLAHDGTATRIRLGGSDLVPEAEILAEAASRRTSGPS